MCGLRGADITTAELLLTCLVILGPVTPREWSGTTGAADREAVLRGAQAEGPFAPPASDFDEVRTPAADKQLRVVAGTHFEIYWQPRFMDPIVDEAARFFGRYLAQRADPTGASRVCLGLSHAWRPASTDAWTFCRTLISAPQMVCLRVSALQAGQLTFGPNGCIHRSVWCGHPPWLPRA